MKTQKGDFPCCFGCSELLIWKFIHPFIKMAAEVPISKLQGKSTLEDSVKSLLPDATFTALDFAGMRPTWNSQGLRTQGSVYATEEMLTKPHGTKLRKEQWLMDPGEAPRVAQLALQAWIVKAKKKDEAEKLRIDKENQARAAQALLVESIENQLQSLAI